EGGPRGGSPPPKGSVSTDEGSKGSAKVSEGSGGGSSDSREPAKGSSAAPPSPPGSGENSLYRIGKDGSVREVFREKAMILSQLQIGGKIFVGTGMQGQLFEIDEASKEKSEIARLDNGQILCLVL